MVQTWGREEELCHLERSCYHQHYRNLPLALRNGNRLGWCQVQVSSPVVLVNLPWPIGFPERIHTMMILVVAPSLGTYEQLTQSPCLHPAS